MGNKKVRKTQKGVRKAGTKSAKVSASSRSMKNDGIDVRTTADVAKLTDLIKSNKIVVVLVYADWCGHCHTFKDTIWNKLSAMPNRKLPLAAVNEKVLSETPVSTAKIDGYPSVLMMGQDMKPAVFKDEAGESTNAMPNTRDLASMETLVSTDPNDALPNAKPAAGDAEPESVESTPSAEENLNNAADIAMNNMGAASATALEEDGEGLSATVSNPPDAEDDLIASHGQALNSMGKTIGMNTASGAAQEGGSLYYALVAAARDIVPAAALAGAAVYLDKRSRRARSARRRRSRAARAAATAKKLRQFTA